MLTFILQEQKKKIKTTVRCSEHPRLTNSIKRPCKMKENDPLDRVSFFMNTSCIMVMNKS